jgi:hypothetical protein
MRRLFAVGGALVSLWFGAVPAAADEVESTKVYTDHPRLFLRTQRLRLLRRETGRDSLRWEQFHLLMSGGAPMDEPGFADALYFRATDDPTAARRAIDWALAPNRDTRQVALVYDWCQEQLKPAEKQTLLRTLKTAASQRPAQTSIGDLRSQLLAAIAIAGDDDQASQAAIQYVLHDQWRGNLLPALRAGRLEWKPGDTYPLYEIFHAVRDNLNADLREDFMAYFSQFPLFDLLSYYPPPFPAAENEFRIPWSPAPGEPDLRVAALSRAAELAMVAFDTNAPESQVLQGWLMNDRFLMRGVFGNPYEFLWANPYQPGLSYYHVPLVMYDEALGRLLVRSSWEDDAMWAGMIGGQLQQFRDGHVIVIDPKTGREPLDLDEAAILFPAQSKHFVSGKKPANDVFLVGLEHMASFHVEPDDEEMEEVSTDHEGVLYLKGVRPEIQVRLTPRLNASRSGEAGPGVETNR